MERICHEIRYRPHQFSIALAFLNTQLWMNQSLTRAAH
jgi:hypothetical protein